MKELKLDFTPRFSRRVGFYSKKGISGTFTSTGGTYGMFAGEKRQMFYKGKGLIFDGYREYTPYDDAKMIDWKASLRANKKLVRKFSEEKNKNIVFMFDVSSTMSYTSHFKLKNEYAAELIASLSWSFLQTGDSVGLVMFADGIKWKRDVLVGENQWFNICKDLSNPEHYEGKFNFTQSAKELLSFLEFESVVILLTDFINIEKEPEWYSYYEVMAARYELVTFMIRDPFDNYLPRGLSNLVISDPQGGGKTIVNMDAIRDTYNEYNSRFIGLIKDMTERLGADFLMLTTNQSFVKPVLNFLRWREEIWR